MPWTRKNASTAGCRTRTAWLSEVLPNSDKHSPRVSHSSSNVICSLNKGSWGSWAAPDVEAPVKNRPIQKENSSTPKYLCRGGMCLLSSNERLVSRETSACCRDDGKVKPNELRRIKFSTVRRKSRPLSLFDTKFQCSLLRQQDGIDVADKQCELKYNCQHLITNLSLNE